jgi:predicted negative regulator of RcsB-dependent stress response
MKEFSLAALKSRTVFGAEAKYNVALLQLENKQYDACIKTAMDLSDNFSSYEYWVAKSFITMADAYAGKGDTFQAKATLESIVDNYDAKDDILPAAKERLNKLNNKKK